MIKIMDLKNIKISEKSFISKTATIIGSVEIKEKASVWYGAVIRGDTAHIHIGKKSNIQDNTVIHADNIDEFYIGDNVTVGHGCLLHCKKIEGNCLIGMGSIIMNGVVIEKNSIIGAGSLVTENKHIGEGQLWMGSPAKYIRDLTDKEIEGIMVSADEYYELLKVHKGDIND